MSEITSVLEREHNERVDDGKRLKFDFTVNINTILGVIALILTMVSYGNKIVSYLGTQNTKINIMWAHWYQDNHSLLSADEKRLVEQLDSKFN